MSHPPADREELIRLLDEERQALLAGVERIRPDARDTRSSVGTWSVAEVLEHLAQVERGIARLIALRGREQPSSDQAAAVPLDAARIARLRGRGTRIEAPERVRPTGRLAAADALRALDESRARLREAVMAAESTALDGCTHPHAVLGVLTLADWVRFVAHHEARHAEQISELARALEESS